MEETNGARSGAAGKTIAIVRILTGIIFLFFGEYKIAGPEFAHGGLAGWVNGWLGANEPVAFYGAFLRDFVLPHQALCARIVGWGELAIGIALVLGLFVRAASVGGAIHMVSLALATWYAPGHGAATWKYFGANLDHILLIFLFAILFATRAGETCGVDGVLRAGRLSRLGLDRGTDSRISQIDKIASH
ncbi:MAG TPA: DoxX family protein [Candidatus Acidoferrales bacterium]|nr:DoxX family protein [Candidatus Acidoferrales bacterium]